MLGLWVDHGGGEAAKFWMSVLSDLNNRGVQDVFFVVCDGLKGLPDSVEAVFPQAVVQTCIIHPEHVPICLKEVLGPDRGRPQTGLHRPEPGRGLEGVRGVRGEVGHPYPAIGRLWRTAWEEFTPSWTTTSRSAECSARLTRSRLSTLATAGP